MANRIQLRRGIKSKLPTLTQGEPAYVTDTHELFIGTGNGNVNMGGSMWYKGTDMGGESTAANAYSYNACPLVKVGDTYLNTSNGNVYECTTAGSGTSAKWTYKGSIRGPQEVYSVDSPIAVGQWIDGKTIYRIVWKVTTEELARDMEHFPLTFEDYPNTPSEIRNCSMIVKEQYIIHYANGMENRTFADRYSLRDALKADSYLTGGNPKYWDVYAIVDYVE